MCTWILLNHICTVSSSWFWSPGVKLVQIKSNLIQFTECNFPGVELVQEQTTKGQNTRVKKVGWAWKDENHDSGDNDDASENGEAFRWKDSGFVGARFRISPTPYYPTSPAFRIISTRSANYRCSNISSATNSHHLSKQASNTRLMLWPWNSQRISQNHFKHLIG